MLSLYTQEHTLSPGKKIFRKWMKVDSLSSMHQEGSQVRAKTYSRAQILQNFHVLCQSLAENNKSGYRREFETLNDTGKEFPCIAGEQDYNKDKNRYPCVLPYDHCRVKLSVLESQPHSDYINASYVPGGCSEHDFICTQAPLQSTMADFWRMVWEQKVQIIVMVTALHESGKVLCNQYWPPERGMGCYGTVQVTTVSHQKGPDCIITNIRLRQSHQSTERHVIHYHYLGWPDQGVPKDGASLCTFTDLVRKHIDDSPRIGPVVVHCSAGVGRSGTFVALLWMMQLCVRGIPPNVRLTVQDLRRHRPMMVQNLEQYIFLHQCLLHWLAGAMPRPSHQNAPLPLHNRQSQRNRQNKRESRSQRRRPDRQHHTESTHSHTPQPQQTTWRSLQTTLQAFHPGKLLRRILPTSRNNSQMPQDTEQ